MPETNGRGNRIAYVVLGGALLALAGYVGAGYLRRPADIVFQSAGPSRTSQPEATPNAPPQPQTASEVVVHVAGQVKNPGVYRLAADSRVDEAIARAGGPGKDADLDRLNLAAKLEDGTQVYVPRKGADAAVAPEPEPNSAYSSPATGPRRTGGSSAGSHSGPKPLPAVGSVSLNSADAKGLQALPGVGPATAQRIVEYRKEHGRFGSIDELLAVKGIGPKKLEKMRPYLKL